MKKKVFFLYLFVSAILFFPIFLGKTLFFKDFYLVDYPIWHFVSESLKNYVIPLWNPYLNFGEPILANTNYLLFYPLSYIRFFFSPLFSINFFVMLHHFSGMFFFYLLLKKLDINEKISILGGIFYGVLGSTISLFYFSNLTPYIFTFPLFLFTLINFIKKLDKKSLIFFSFSLSLLIFTFEPFFLLGILISSIFIYFFFKAEKSSLKKIIVSIFISFLITSPFLYEGYREYKAGIRQFTKCDVKNLSRGYDFPPSTVGGFFFENFFGENFKIKKRENFYKENFGARSPLFITFFLSTSLLIFFIYSLISFRKKFFIFPLLTLFFLLLSSGNFSPILSKTIKAIPILGNGRYFQKFLFFFSFFFLISAISGIESFLKEKKFKILITSFFISLFLISFSYLLYLSHLNGKKLFFSPLFLTSLFLTVFLLKNKDYLKHLIFLIIFAELIYGNFTSLKFAKIEGKSLLPEVKNERITFLDNELPLNKNYSLQNFLKLYRELDFPFSGFLDNIKYGFNEPIDYMETKNSAYLSEYFGKLPIKEKIILSKKLNVKYLITSNSKDLEKFRNGVLKIDGLYIMENKDVFNILYFPTSLRLGNVKNLIDFPNKRIAYINKPIKDKFDFNGGKIKPIKENANEKIFEVYSKGKNFLVLTETFSKDWHSYVDGKEVKIERANTNFMGIKILKGKHIVTFKYFPQKLYFFLLISLITLITCIFEIFVEARSKKT